MGGAPPEPGAERWAAALAGEALGDFGVREARVQGQASMWGDPGRGYAADRGETGRRETRGGLQ